ncbi:hypothetical protein, partial [Caldalkalibacillus salinus]|uniref:hypothetical protein n=1 Tax=Caldalkalibacillus salinus TaxID=2803787 RepID=UPI001924FE0A
YINPELKEESRKKITKYSYDDITSVDSFELHYDPSHFYCAFIDGNFAKRSQGKILKNTLFFDIHRDSITNSTMPEHGECFVPGLEMVSEDIKTEEVIESQEKLLAQQLRMIQLTGA